MNCERCWNGRAGCMTSARPIGAFSAGSIPLAFIKMSRWPNPIPPAICGSDIGRRRAGRAEAAMRHCPRGWCSAGLTATPLGVNPGYGKLLLHLVISHHGKGRPLVVPVEDPTTANVSGEIEGALYEVSASLCNVDWNQPSRFRWLNREFGPWGLALLEAIVRQADHVVSSDLP